MALSRDAAFFWSEVKQLEDLTGSAGGWWHILEQAEFAGQAFEAGARGCRWGNERQAHAFAALAHQAEDGFGRARVGLPEVGIEEASEAAFDLACGGPVVIEGGVDHAGNLGGSFIRGDADEAIGANADGGQRKVVIAREDLEAFGEEVDELGDLRELARGLFDGLNIGGGGGQAGGGFGLKVRGGAAGNVVEHDRQRIDGAGQGEEVLILALLRGLVVVGIRGENGGDAGYFLEPRGQAKEGAGGVVRATGPDGDAPGGGIDDGAEGLDPLLLFEGGGFTGRATGDDEVDAGLDLPFDESAKGVGVDRTVGAERSNDCSAQTSGIHQEKFIPKGERRREFAGRSGMGVALCAG